MEITTDLVKHLSDLSRLEFDEKETENFKQEFTNILKQVDKISNADVEGIEIKDEMLDAKTQLREDGIKQGLTNKEAIKNAPDSLGNSVLIPVEIV